MLFILEIDNISDVMILRKYGGSFSETSFWATLGL